LASKRTVSLCLDSFLPVINEQYSRTTHKSLTNSAGWVSQTQSHIVVTINYRMSILGFSNAFGVEDQNLGLLNMRVTLEWVRDNIRSVNSHLIAARHSDNNLGTLASAGASAVDYHHYAFWEDPIAHAFFAQSGNVLYSGGGGHWDHTNFTFVANSLLAPYTVDNPLEGPSQTVANGITERILCGAANSSIERDSIGLTKYRYQYAGNWTNQDPLPWMGAFHSSELVMVSLESSSTVPVELLTSCSQLFGSYAVGQGPPKEEPEVVTSRVMKDYLLAFIKLSIIQDPYNGPSSMGWVPFNTSAENQGTMLRFDANGKAVQNVSASDVEAVCSGS
ncbi:hypothetical protein D0862_12381, partial [Hortaea werneckii]